MKFRTARLRVAAAGAAVLLSGTANAFSIPWWSIDGGGTTYSTGGAWIIAGSIGQHDASQALALSGGAWTLVGGFWAQYFYLPVGDVIFRNDFEI